MLKLTGTVLCSRCGEVLDISIESAGSQLPYPPSSHSLPPPPPSALQALLNTGKSRRHSGSGSAKELKNTGSGLKNTSTFWPRKTRAITDEDRRIILSHHALNWTRETKLELARKLGLGIVQIRAVIAHTHPNLGGQQYLNRYI